MTTTRKLLLICLGALLFRLALLPMIEHPGIGDPNHYYNLGIFLTEGKGLNIDYVWQYNDPPEQLLHPDDYWMPLNNYFVAAGVLLFGQNVAAALLPFVLMGAIAPALAFIAAKQFKCEDDTALFAAASIAVLPDLLIRSLQSDTTMPNVLLVVGAILLVTYGFQRGQMRYFVLAGLLGGVAYLVRSDSSLLIPMVIVTTLVYALWGRDYGTIKRYALYTGVMVITMVAVMTPWFIRNKQLNGTISTPKLDQMFFLTDYREHFVYDDPITLETMLEKQTIGEIIAKRVFEMAASAKVMISTLDVFLPVVILGGLLLLIGARDRQRMLTLAPTVILILGIYVFYTILVPMKSQGGSFKKAYLTLTPLLVPVAAYALERAINDRRIRAVTMVIAVLIMGANAFDVVRLDVAGVRNYINFTDTLVETALSLPDTNGDDEIILMSQDPFMLRMNGIRSVMIPMDDREAVMEIVERYNVDYMLLPADRPALDGLLKGTDDDPRFYRAADLPGTTSALFGFNTENGS